MKAALAAILLAITTAGCASSQGGPLLAEPRVIAAQQVITGWFCPMHPNHTSHQTGNCPICGMALVAGDPFDTRDYLLDFETRPAAVKPGIPVEMIFRVRHPGTRAVITDYERVHDKEYHLFVISDDLSSFQHVHPDRRADGSWHIDVTLPEAGYYRVLSDFLPSRGAPQFLSRTLVTADFEGDMESEAGQIVADTFFRKDVDTITASVEFDPPRLIAGQYGHLQFNLTDAKTGQPVTDLQPYLGAFGHTLILSEDMLSYVHSHPSEGLDGGVQTGLGGPRASFEGYMPRPGRYRSWTQFLRNGQLTTVSFTFNVLALEDAMGILR